jgi:hypothetical protein
MQKPILSSKHWYATFDAIHLEMNQLLSLAVLLQVEALCYKPEGREFDSR